MNVKFHLIQKRYYRNITANVNFTWPNIDYQKNQTLPVNEN